VTDASESINTVLSSVVMPAIAASEPIRFHLIALKPRAIKTGVTLQASVEPRINKDLPTSQHNDRHYIGEQRRVHGADHRQDLSLVRTSAKSAREREDLLLEPHDSRIGAFAR
jgi:hypothetical protein